MECWETLFFLFFFSLDSSPSHQRSIERLDSFRSCTYVHARLAISSTSNAREESMWRATQGEIMNIFTYIRSCRCMRVIAKQQHHRPSRFWTKWVVLLKRTESARGRWPSERERGGGEKERETTAFSLLASAGGHSTSASIVFRESHRDRVNDPLNLARKTPVTKPQDILSIGSRGRASRNTR